MVWPPDLNGVPQLLKAVKKTRIPEEIVQQVHQLIRDGVLAPGDRLPPERELAQQLNVSRASVREAMRLLDISGLVEVRPGAGTFITEDTVEAIIQAFSSMNTSEAASASDVFEMRLLLEPHVVSLAADRATEADIRRMNETLDSQEDDIAAGGTGVEFDSQFHYAIADATKNSALMAVTQAISDILSQSREPSLQSPERSRLSLQSHRRILASIEGGQSEEAARAMIEHISEIDRQIHNLASPIGLAERGKR